MNTNLRTEAKDYFENDFFKSMNNSVFGKTTENIRKYRVFKLVTTDKRRDQLASEAKYFSEDISVIEMKKAKVKLIRQYI